MKACFRVDSSTLMGSGHLMRCLTLAWELRSRGVDVLFVSRPLAGNLCDCIERDGFGLRRLPSPGTTFVPGRAEPTHASWLVVAWETDCDETLTVIGGLSGCPDWLIVDSYALDARWERRLRPYVGRIMVIDDLADRSHDCDLLLDQNLNEELHARYCRLIPDSSQTLLGPSYALLRPEFTAARGRLAVRDGRVERVLIFFGGSDRENETEKAIAALKLLNRPDLAVDVVVGGASPHIERIRELCRVTENCTFHCQVSHMAELMVAADLAIGAGGSTMWERCCLGLPSVVLTIADNQVPIARECAKAEACFYLGNAKEITRVQLAAAVERVMGQPELLTNCSLKALRLVDGRGAARVVERLVEHGGEGA